MGFGTHPHDNMEIITIPLEGDLAHKDSMGNTEIIRNGDVQVMSAETSEANSIQTKTNELNCCKFGFSKPKNVEPRYQQITLDPEERNNKLHKFFHQMQRMREFGFIKTPGFIWVI
jgi:redox-sensitive bicupin YhaK (pirin superfamily)